VLDLYGDAAVGALYKRPYEKEEGEEEIWLAAMRAEVSSALEIPPENIFLKERQRFRRRQETGTQYSRMSKQSFYRDVKEGDLSFRVNLSDYLDTGLFLDARRKRALIRGEAAGKRVLNLFAYTCSLSAAAAKGGASHVESVDLSNTYLDWGKVNFTMNGLETGFSFTRSDVIEFIIQAKQKAKSWDIIILDPPGFSFSNKMTRSLDIRRDHRELIQRCLSLLGPGGKLWFSSNARALALNNDDYPGFAVKNMEKDLLDEDIKGKKIPFCCTFEGVT
jgi:23S rRNA G2069 N7-methylase RlmK/C1962 C5-methylase RlmI